MKVGVVGLGYWGSKVIEEYATLRENGEIDRIVAIDTEPDALASAQLADEKFKSVNAALTEVDALHVSTSNDSHFAIAKTALNSGVDVLVEKPLTTDRRRAYDLVEIASESGCILQTGHIFRFANVVREVKKKYESGYFGQPNIFTLRWTHELETPRTDGVLWDLLPHPIDILNFVTGEWPVRETGISKRDSAGRPAVARIGLTFEDFLASIEVSWIDKSRRRSLEIAGTRRTAVVDCVGQTFVAMDGDNEDVLEIEPNNTIMSEIENFIHAIETGENKFNSAIVGARTVDAIQSVEETVIDV